MKRGGKGSKYPVKAGKKEEFVYLLYNRFYENYRSFYSINCHISFCIPISQFYGTPF